MVKRKKALCVTAAFLLLHVILTAVATKIVYDKVFDRYDKESEIDESFSDLVEGREKHSFTSGDERLYGWLYDTDGTDDVIVMMPGLRSSADDYLPLIKSFTEGKMDVFIFDPAGSCMSEGDSAEGFPRATQDLCAAVDYVEENISQYDDIFLFGHSRGGYAVCCATGEMDDVSAAASVNAPNSPMEGVVSPVESKAGIFAYNNYPLLWAYQATIFGTAAVNTSAADVIGSSDVPILVVQAENDTIVSPHRFSVFSHKDEVKREGAEFLLYEGDKDTEGHSGVLFSEGRVNEDLSEKILEFYKKLYRG